jgi:hypothetical protein
MVPISQVFAAGEVIMAICARELAEIGQVNISSDIILRRDQNLFVYFLFSPWHIEKSLLIEETG